ncbi:MAG: LysE family translocator [Deltaproteobacteria bacterium]|jgi:threonine/homoserine/homoserine lactone efflux protein|nr:MAG: LysE family translocator [Deltaproteobacteria bacterium]
MAPGITFLFSGVVFGLSGGLTPGPLLTLVISETLKHDVKEGIKVAIAPLLTDLPIVLITIVVLSRLENILPLLGVVSLLGSAFLTYLAYESISFKGVDIDLEQERPQSMRKGVIVNFLNPSPYMFWFTIGAPLVLKALNIGVFSAFLFVFGFYVFLVGSKVVVAVVVGKSRFFLKSRNYIYTVRFLGIILLVFAGLFLKDSLELFGVI